MKRKIILQKWRLIIIICYKYMASGAFSFLVRHASDLFLFITYTNKWPQKKMVKVISTKTLFEPFSILIRLIKIMVVFSCSKRSKLQRTCRFKTKIELIIIIKKCINYKKKILMLMLLNL